MVSRFLFQTFIFLNETVSTEKGISVLFKQGISIASQEGVRLNAVYAVWERKIDCPKISKYDTIMTRKVADYFLWEIKINFNNDRSNVWTIFIVQSNH